MAQLRRLTLAVVPVVVWLQLAATVHQAGIVQAVKVLLVAVQHGQAVAMLPRVMVAQRSLAVVAVVASIATLLLKVGSGVIRLVVAVVVAVVVQ